MIARRAQYNRQVILFDRWRIPYAPAYGWVAFWQEVLSFVLRTPPPYRRRRSDDA